MNLLLLSNSTQHGRGYLEHALDTVTGFLPAGARLAFVPYALADHDTYTARVVTEDAFWRTVAEVTREYQESVPE
ncbi:Type 1 glutamine amidotransferase-like domain-containing protein, partial [Streptomyces tendae]|uniref:Type 1 glutamine amidotransferase-like domain-containing protein n=1 Tax=Streptomyces tendae TaxID=1932 RepID=UPI0033B97AA3